MNFFFTTLSLLLILSCSSTCSKSKTSDKLNFSLANQEIPSLLFDIKYFGSDNFVGEVVNGYEAPHCYLTLQATKALKLAQLNAQGLGLTLKVFDCYRPQIAVDHFVRWAKDSSNTSTKKSFYPNIQKEFLFSKGYIAKKSGHSRGSTIDLTLANSKTGIELDMGTTYDFLDPLSNTANTQVTIEQKKNRALLVKIMEDQNFKNYSKEWWHFSLRVEPFPETYFNFTVE